MSTAITDVAARAGITVPTDAECLRIDRKGNEALMMVACGGTLELRGFFGVTRQDREAGSKGPPPGADWQASNGGRVSRVRKR